MDRMQVRAQRAVSRRGIVLVTFLALPACLLAACGGNQALGSETVTTTSAATFAPPPTFAIPPTSGPSHFGVIVTGAQGQPTRVVPAYLVFVTPTGGGSPVPAVGGATLPSNCTLVSTIVGGASRWICVLPGGAMPGGATILATAESTASALSPLPSIVAVLKTPIPVVIPSLIVVSPLPTSAVPGPTRVVPEPSPTPTSGPG